MRTSIPRATMLLVAALFTAIVCAADAAVLCQKRRSGVVVVRDACKPKETQLDLAAFGAVGPAGPPGVPGAPGAPGAAPTTRTLVFPANSLGMDTNLTVSQYGVRFPDWAGTGTTTGEQATLLMPRPTDWNASSPVTVSATFLNPGFTATGFLRFLIRPFSFGPPPDSYANAGQITAPAQQMTTSFGTYTFTWEVPASTLANATWSLRFARANNGADPTFGGDVYNSPIDLLSVTVVYAAA